MTVSTEVNHNEYTGNGVTTIFPYAFRIFQASDLLVTTSDTNGTLRKLTLNTDYTVSGVGSYSGGTVILPVPLGNGWSISIERDLPVVQETDLRNQGRFFAETHENVFDYLTMLIQQSFSWRRLALLKPNFLARYYDAKQNKISNLADPELLQDAVNNRTMRNYVDSAIAGVIGGFGWFIQNGAGAVYRTFQDKMRDRYDVRDFGQLIVGADNTAVFQKAALAVYQNGGGIINVPPGVWYAYGITLYSNVYWQGAGKGSTVLTQPVGKNSDIFISHNFFEFTGIGPLVNAPKNFGISGITINGNYLENYTLAALDGDTTINNTIGFGVRVFGSKYHIDIEVVNCPQVGFYSEAFNYTGYGYEQDSTLRLSGRVFGKEAIVFRGPADINIEHVIIGCPGWLPTEAARQSSVVMSDLFPGEPVHVMVSDETVTGASRYNGHHEFTFMHLYGNYSGYGYKTINTGRLKGSHLVCENCRGGAYFGNRVWGEISIIECHNNGRNPATLAGTLDIFPDIDSTSLQSFNFNATIRRTKMESPSYIGLRSSGKQTRANVNYYPIGSIPDNSPVALITSQDSEYDIMLTGVSGDAVSVSGVNNRIAVSASDVTGGSVVKRVSGGSSQNRNNDIRINAHNVANILNLDGLVTTESFKILGELNSGQTVISGSAIDMVNRGISLDIAARVSGVLATSYDVGRVNLDNTVTTEQTISVNHNYFQQPDAAQVSFNLYDPSPTYTGAMQYIYLQNVTATQLTFVYKLSSTGSSGPLVLCWRIQ